MKLFFICFNSCLSSSSMKLSYKCILTPNRRSNREPSHTSLSSSLSRKLRSSGSIRSGQASPMFPTVGKKKGCALENPEPSSPKVTCIGQVRVKTRKQGKKMTTRSKRRKEASFRKTDHSFQVAANPDLSGQKSLSFQYQSHQNLQQECLPHGNQRWVHLPLAICETLRRFGAEFNHCFFPCRSSCTSSERVKEEKAGGGREGSGGGDGRESSGGAAFAGWLVALQEGEDRMDRQESSQTRRVLEDIDMDVEKKDEFVGEEEGKARVSICIPPKNALLLMRCRSDPVKMTALANRFWEPTDQNGEEGEEEEDNGDDEGEVEEDTQVRRNTEIQTGAKQDSTCEEHLIPEAQVEAKPVAKGSEIGSREIPELHEVNQGEQDETLMGKVEVDEEFEPNMLQESEKKLKEKENEDEDDYTETSLEATEEEEKETRQRLREDEETDPKLPKQKVGPDPESKEEENQTKPKRETCVLPECLVLMMCEPKLSMEVSKETWVCSTDFIQWLPEKPRKKKKDSGDEPKKRISIESKPPPPPRSSCSSASPAAGISMSTMIEQKLMRPKSKACEPFVLTRCKSEPMRSSASVMVAPEAAAATLGTSAPGVGF